MTPDMLRYAVRGLSRSISNRYACAFVGLLALSFILPRLDPITQDLLQTLGLRPIRHAVVLVDLRAVAHLRARVSEHLPPDQVSVTAMHRVTEHSFDCVLPQVLE